MTVEFIPTFVNSAEQLAKQRIELTMSGLLSTENDQLQ